MAAMRGPANALRSCYRRVALDPSSSIGREAILKAADGAMYRAKRACGDRVNVCEPKPARASGAL